MAALLCLAGCRAARLPVTVTETRDSVVIREVEYVERLRDTTIYVGLPDEKRKVTLRRDSSRLETSLAESMARIEADGSLSHTLRNKPLKIPVRVAVTERATLVAEQKETGSRSVVEVPVRLPLRGLEKFLLCCGVLFCALLAGKALFLIIRRVG